MFASRRVFTRSLHGKTVRLSLGPSHLSFFSTGNFKTSGGEGFHEVLSFHDSVAAVREHDGGSAYHIDSRGDPLYNDRRYKRTFGFYAAERAAVMDFDDKFFHIDLTGQPVYADRYEWCGNFHSIPAEGVFRSPVRDTHYFYIDQYGQKTLGPFSYAGDPNSAGHSVVYDHDGNPMIIDVYGKDWCTGARTFESRVIEALVPHKGIALVRDKGGWFYINQGGDEMAGGQRFLFAEPHYNGQAKVRFTNGQWGVIDEHGKLLHSLGESMLSSSVELEDISKRYWDSMALKKVLENDILQNDHAETRTLSTSKTFLEVLNDCAAEMGLFYGEQLGGSGGDTSSRLSNRGLLLSASLRGDHSGGVGTTTEDRCRYWLQDRYLQAWLECPQKSYHDTFAALADDPASVEQSQRVLKSYADADWEGAGTVLSKMLCGPQNSPERIGDHRLRSIRTILDMGGGYGSLLRELQRSGLFPDTNEFICVDRPEVVASVSSSSVVTSPFSATNEIKYVAGDLFDGPLQDADLYLMSRVLHDWPDHEANAILQRLHAMSSEDARLCVIDRVSTPDKPHGLLSLHMFAIQGSRERNHEQWLQLFTSSGWQIDNREHFNGHEMYMLTKTEAPFGSFTAFEGGSSLPNLGSDDSSRTGQTVRKAVVTAGGLGTRMEPQSFITPKALLPLVSRDHQINGKDLPTENWNVRPALSFILDQLRDACHIIDQVFVVSNPQQIPLLKDFLRDYERQIYPKGRKQMEIQILTQPNARGFGDAVLAARRVIGDEPFLLSMGDHVFSANCIENMLESYNKMLSSSTRSDWRTTALTGVTLCNGSEVAQTGLLRNQESSYPLGTPWPVHEMVEKPYSNYESFQFPRGDPVRYLSQLGIDVLPPSIFSILQKEKDRISAREEVDLRKVLRESLQSDGLLFGCLIDGHRLDIGNPRAYCKSFQAVANDRTGLYKPATRPSMTSEEVQGQDEILRSVRALQLDNSVNIPATLRHVLFSSEDSGCLRSDKIHVSSSPGRMDLMCGFADYSGSYAIQHPTAERLISLAVVKDSTKWNSGVDKEGTIRLACVQLDKVSELSGAVASGDFKVREAAFPTSDLFTAAGRLKGVAELRTGLSERIDTADSSNFWEHYITGIIHRILRHSNEGKPPIGKDFTVVTLSELPWNTGLASSAAVEVATALSLGNALQLSPDLLEPGSLSMLCKEVENTVVGAPCGILDQLAVTHRENRTIDYPLVGMRCRMSSAETPTYSLPLPEGLAVIALESGIKRSTASTTYRSVKTGAATGKAILEGITKEKIQFLCDLSPSRIAQYESSLPERLSGAEILAMLPDLNGHEDFRDVEPTTTYPVRAATSFPIKENHRVQVFQQILLGVQNSAIPRESGLQVLAELMAQTHTAYNECGLGSEQTDVLVDLLKKEGAIGAKISGGGGGGAVVALVNDSWLRNSVTFEKLQERYHASTGLACTLRRGTSGPAKYHGVLRRHFSTHDCNNGEHGVKPRILVVNHGYPPDFNGGSEVYAQMVALQLKNSGQCETVHVFAREHDPYRPDFEIRETFDQLDSDLPVFRMNYPREAPYFRFCAEEVDHAFQDVVNAVKPDIVHLHHMNHLSLNLPAVAKSAGAKVLYTLHDFWLMCPRGQFLQTGPERNEAWKLCDGQHNDKCAQYCFTGRYGTGACDGVTGQDDSNDQRYWTSWIASRMEATRNACDHIDAFISPSQHLRDKVVNEFLLPADKVIVEPYGFFRERLANRKDRFERHFSSTSNHLVESSSEKNPYTFAYIGRHQPGKGINLLVEAALKLLQDACTGNGAGTEDIPFRVKIFGRQEANSTRSLQRIIAECPDPRVQDIFSWEAEYVNKDIVDKVFNAIDCVVVPSIWEENSPLVIHEAQQSRLPIITSSFGGMGELVINGVNGLTFEHRNADSLAEAMQKALEQPAGMRYLGEQGYLYSADGQIPCIQEHTEFLLGLFDAMRTHNNRSAIAKIASSSWYTTAYAKIHGKTGSAEAEGSSRSQNESGMHSIEHLPVPWRVTFDTNPDDCNFSCTMCEQHSEHSPHQKERREMKIRKRRMDFEIIRKTVADLAPKGLREIIPSTMGEPLYYKDFPKILDLCREHNVKLNLTTNGSFYNDGVEAWARRIIPVGSDVKISWNGIKKETQEKIMKGSNLDDQIANLRKFIEIRNEIADQGVNYCSVTLQLTFMEVNLEELPELVKFAIDEDCDRVKGHHLWAHFSEIKDESLRRSKESLQRWNTVATRCREIAATHSRPSGKPFRLENFFDLEIPQEDNEMLKEDHSELVCPFLGREAWVNHSGRFDPCCAPDEQRKSLGSFGNITDKETRLVDIWNSDQYKDLVQNYTKHPLCRNCNMRRPASQ